MHEVVINGQNSNIFDRSNQIKEWCEQNLSGKWARSPFTLVKLPTKYRFEFESDAMAFKLMWG